MDVCTEQAGAVKEADEGSRVVEYHFWRELIEGGIVSRKPVTRHVVGQALKPDQTVKVEGHRGTAKMHPKDNRLVKCTAGAVLFQVCYAALQTATCMNCLHLTCFTLLKTHNAILKN